jgi:hypothetical protein
MVTVCGKLSAASWLWPLQAEFAAQRVDACRVSPSAQSLSDEVVVREGGRRGRQRLQV